MSNFYGGREGRSFVISKTFSSVKEMVESFKLGPSYTEVRYEEHVMINTPNKANPENGQVFRRGYDFDSTRKIKTYNVERDGSIKKETFVVEEVLAGGAIYVGTIAGPAGRAPKFQFNSLSKVLDMKHYAAIDLSASSDVISTISAMQDYLNTLTKNYPNHYLPVTPWQADSTEYEHNIASPAVDAQGNVSESEAKKYTWLPYVKITILKGEEPVEYSFYKDSLNYLEEDSIGWYLLDSSIIVPEDSFNLQNDLIPGVIYGADKTETSSEDGVKRVHKTISKRNEEIKWAYCSIRNENNEDTIAYVGFQIPYTIVEFEAESASPFYNRSNSSHKFNNYNLITNKETKPFYNKWEIKIPKGIKGSGIESIYIAEANNTMVTITGRNEATGELTTTPYTGRADDIANKRKVIVCKYVTYDRKEEGESYIVYLGDFNVLVAENGESAIQLDDDGTFHINFTHDDDITYDKKLTWLTHFTLNENDGMLTVNFNNETPTNVNNISKQLIWVKDITVAADGTITYHRTDKDVVDSQKIRWINSVTFDKEGTGNFNIDFNNGTDFSTNIKYAETLSKENDHLKVDYSDSRGIVDLGSVCYAAAASADSEALKAKIAPTGLWFITENYTVPED